MNGPGHTMTDIISGISSLFYHRVGEPLLFSSGLFWVMFIGFILVYAVVQQRKVQMMLYVAVFSLFFYYLCNGVACLLLLFTALADWILAQRIHRSKKNKTKKLYLILSIAFSAGLLVYFKYSNLLIHTWNGLFSGNVQPIDLFLPVGISFYTFQTISYVVDVYKGKTEPARSFLQYIFYLSFFPLILAGPIMRAGKFFPQIQDGKRVTKAMIYGGLWLVIIGIVKKAILADYIAQYNNWVFDAPLHYSGFEGVMAILGYTAQIYCDFSGYSDMSIGLASIMGFDLGENFNFPYQARNLSDFWRRWHISLSTWMRDYIYIPLGGNRGSKWRVYPNIMITMLIAGLWHGASWMFVIWGVGHGMGLIIQKVNKPWLDRLPDHFMVRFCSWLLTFVFVALLWVVFRSESLGQSVSLFTHIWADFDITYALPFLKARATWCVCIALIFLWHVIHVQAYEQMKTCFIRLPWIVKVLILLTVVQLVIQYQTNSVQPFIYFRF